MSRSKRITFIILGSLFVALAGVGTLIPVLPTTPLLLLAAYFYARSSQRFYTWLVNNRWFGEYIRNYRDSRGMALRHKVITISLLWLSIGSTVIFAVSNWWVRALLLAVAVGVTAHLVMIKSPRRPAPPAPAREEARLPEEAA